MIDETHGMDDFSTVISTTKPGIDPGVIIGTKQVDDSSTLIAWPHDIVNGKMLHMVSNTDLTCPQCKRILNFINSDSCSCGWEVPESFREVEVTFNHQTWLFEHFQMVDVAWAGAYDLLETLVRGDREGIARMLEFLLTRHARVPETLMALYPAVLDFVTHEFPEAMQHPIEELSTVEQVHELEFFRRIIRSPKRHPEPFWRAVLDTLTYVVLADWQTYARQYTYNGEAVLYLSTSAGRNFLALRASGPFLFFFPMLKHTKEDYEELVREAEMMFRNLRTTKTIPDWPALTAWLMRAHVALLEEDA